MESRNSRVQVAFTMIQYDPDILTQHPGNNQGTMSMSLEMHDERQEMELATFNHDRDFISWGYLIAEDG
jgi:hypothetical protein